MKITDFYEGYSDAPQKLRFLTILCKSVLIFDRFLLFVPDARQLLMQKSYESPIFVKKYRGSHDVYLRFESFLLIRDAVFQLQKTVSEC